MNTLLVLPVNIIGNSGAAALSNSLRRNTSLTELQLASSQHQTPSTTDHTVDNTQEHTADNVIGDCGATALGQALQDNTTLTVLDLSCWQPATSKNQSSVAIKHTHYQQGTG